jgi:hypothetical protein
VRLPKKRRHAMKALHNIVVCVLAGVSPWSIAFGKTACKSSSIRNPAPLGYYVGFIKQGEKFHLVRVSKSGNFAKIEVQRPLADCRKQGWVHISVVNCNKASAAGWEDGGELPPSDGPAVGSTRQLLGDVNGDGLADAVEFFADSGSWYVSASDGEEFADDYRLWMSGHGVGSSNQFLADVNGDGMADAAVFFGAGSLAGNWYVALSNGAAFGPYYALWGVGHGVGSTFQGLADVTGDGAADALVYFGGGQLAGQWYAEVSLGGAFSGYSRWYP